MIKVWGSILVAASALVFANASFAQDACPASTDINGDGVTDAADAQVIVDAYGTQADDSDFVASADLNGDGQVTTIDFGVLMNCN